MQILADGATDGGRWLRSSGLMALLLWMVDHRTRTITVFRTALDATVYAADQIIDGGRVLPGWLVNIAELFRRLDRQP